MGSRTAAVLVLVLGCLMTSTNARGDSLAPPEPGVALELARARRAAIEALEYDLSFTIPASLAEPVRGRNRVSVRLREVTSPLVLDFDAGRDAVTSVAVNGAPVDADVRNGHIVVPASRLAAGDNIVEIVFVAGDGPLNRSDDWMYTLFVPARAHRAFPCFDQPDLKARVRLDLDLPPGWQAVANGAEESREERDGRVSVRFARTPPLPTYLVAFAAGTLQVASAEIDGRTFRMFHRETDAARLARNRDAIFRLHADALSWLEQYTGIPYAWGKFDFFVVPAFQFGGMEHAGAIFYNGPSLLLEESATQAQLLGRASLIAHETAHMWFGDLVTMRWFDDVWMKEVFANFFAAKIVNPAFPGIDHDLRFLLAHYPAAYEIDRTAGTHPIRQPLDNLDAAGTLYGAIIYQKAPIVMRQLERLIGEGPFREGMREYLTKYAHANASWPELIALLDARTPDDLAAWSRIWVESPGRADVKTEIARDAEGRVTSLALTQSDPRGGDRLWPQSAAVLIGTSDGVSSADLRLDQRRTAVLAGVGRAATFVLPSGGGLAYGRFLLDAESIRTLLDEGPRLEPALTRGAVLVTLWDLMLARRVSPAEWMAFTVRWLERETDEQLIGRALSYGATTFWRFLGPEQRARVAPGLEAAMRAGLARSTTRTAKATWFQGLVQVATTGDTVSWLSRVWRREERVEGLPLGEPEEITLAQMLAVHEVPAWQDVLSEQERRITNPDRRARFAFVRPALDADPAVRDRFFASLADVANRRREPWVLEALGYLHHPLRASRSERYVQPSLEMLEEIRRTGDIFFPKRWLDATLGGHRSRAVADTVATFLASRPDYPERLRRIVLQSADELMRAAGTDRPDGNF